MLQTLHRWLISLRSCCMSWLEVSAVMACKIASCLLEVQSNGFDQKFLLSMCVTDTKELVEAHMGSSNRNYSP